ncbi:GAF domain-containing protein, partial [Modestobacter sp. Leaf380]|uniref:GAF domain-containing protein n=1 Tax=Modestobacter sp. Leaf380 TaxID=1736356 RepID=UPI00350F3D2B
MSSHIPADDTADDRAADDRVSSVSGDPDTLDRETHRAAGQPITSPQLGSVDVAGLDALGRLLLGSESIASVLHRAASYAHRALSVAQEVSVSLISGGHRASAAWTGLLAFELDECQHGTGYGPCLEAARTGTIVVIEDTATETRWPEFVALAARQGVGSTLSVPIPIAGDAQAALNLYAATAGAFEPLAVAGARHVAGQVAGGPDLAGPA